jgi:methyl-accepting chemotaxis protein
VRWLRPSVRGKILWTIIAVSLVVLALGAYAALNAVQTEQGRGQYLQGHLDRFTAEIGDAGTAEYVSAQFISSDPALVSALGASDAVKVGAAAQRLSELLQGELKPDLLIISDAAGTTFAGASIQTLSSEDWRATRLFQDLRAGTAVNAKLAVIRNVAYSASGVPVTSGGRVVGTVCLASDLNRFMTDFAARSGTNDPERQQRVSLVANGQVVASALPRKKWSQLANAVAHPTAMHQGDVSVPVLKFDDGRVYDFAQVPASGYDQDNDAASSQLGSFCVVRAHSVFAQEIRQAFDSVLWMLGIACLIAFIVGGLLTTQITRPLKRYIHATEDLSRGHGDLSKRLEIETHDELGNLARNLNHVFAKIHSLAAGVQCTAFRVNESSREISAVSKQMLDGAKEQASKIDFSNVAVTKLSSSIQQVAENAAEATRTAKSSGEAVTRAIQRLDQIRQTVEEAAARISTLGESVKRIGNIVEVIRQFSEQTTMLALNAAIEAAHAGEHGRGFAVVADEVSSLAKRTGQSARDIEDVIATIRDQTGEAVRTMQEGSREVEQGTGLIENTLADLKTLIGVIDDTASAVQEQAIASDEIARNMDAVQRIATDVLASSESAVQQGDRLQELADELEQSVKGFRIDPERAALDEAELKALHEGHK